MNLGWKARVGLVVSGVWLCIVFLAADEYQRINQILGLGFLPLVVIWGIFWAVAGWRAQRPKKNDPPEATVLETKRKRNHRIRTLIAVVTVLVIGLFSATWQFHVADNEAGGNAVAYWFGEWLIYGLFAYVVFRLPSRWPPGTAAILAALVIVAGVNYKTHAAISEDRQTLASLAKAVPLINKMQSGAQLSDQEVKDAHVGIMEPIMLAQAAFSREVATVAVTYTKAIAGLQPELMLTPASLASSGIRTQTRDKLKVWRMATADYKTQLDAATARCKLGIQAAQSQMPAVMAASASKGFDKASARLGAYVAALVSSEDEASSAITAILDLLDANPGGYALDKGPPATLLFRDEATLTYYRKLMDTVVTASQVEAEAQARLVKAQSDLTDKLTDLLKR